MSEAAGDYDSCIAAITAAMERKERDNDANGFEAPELIDLARAAYGVMGTEVATLRSGAHTLGDTLTHMARSMEAARIEMLQHGPAAAMEWILRALPDQRDDPEGMSWDGSESAREWLDRTEVAQ